jgi:hypothetical protein
MHTGNCISGLPAEVEARDVAGKPKKRRRRRRRKRGGAGTGKKLTACDNHL